MKRLIAFLLAAAMLTAGGALAAAGYTVAMDDTVYSPGTYMLVTVTTPSDEWYTIEILKGSITLMSYSERGDLNQVPILIPANWENGTDYVFRAGRGADIAVVGFAVKAAEAITPKVTPVVASPQSSTVTAGTKVTLSTATPDAAIYYTLNGATPTKASTLYTSAGITINATATLKAIAVKGGHDDSDILTQTYTVNVGGADIVGSSIVGGGGGGGGAPPAQQGFTDTANHWAAASIGVVVERGLFKGVNDSTFDPGGTMTRAMFATVLARLNGVDLTAWDAAANFDDVPGGQWYTTSVAWASDRGIVSGTGGGSFRPDAPVTREQMSVMLYNYIKFMDYALPQVETGPFADGDQISPWAVDAVAYMQSTGLLTGKEGGIFDPQATATRAEVATIFARLIEKLENM